MGDLRYPIGKFEWIPSESEELMAQRRAHYLEVLARAPLELRKAIQGLSEAQLDTPYRPEGWTVRQVVHHVPDSHLNAYVRTKLALTEDRPTIRTYKEAEWARLSDSSVTQVEVSLQLLAALHTRWVDLLRSLKPADFARTFQHPERGEMNLDQLLAMYAWHSAHHNAHITSLRERMGWNRRTADR